MCGFTCIVFKETPPKSFSHINPKDLRHRGPDFTGEFVHKNVFFRHWRLSIVDLTESSNQPISDDRKTLMYNGELFDFEKLGANFGFSERGDTRTLFRILDLPNYKDLLRSTPGFYSFLLYQKNTNFLKGGRDPLGKKPLYYYIDDEKAIFSSEIKGITPYLKEAPICKDTVESYLLYKNKFSGLTFYRGIFEFAPGSFFDFDLTQWKLKVDLEWQKYYDTPIIELIGESGFEKLDDAGSKKDIFEILKASILRRIDAEVPVQIALSSGVDSTLVAALGAKSSASKKVQRTLTVGFNSQHDESEDAREISRALGFSNTKIQFDSASILALLRAAVNCQLSPVEHPHAMAYFILCQEAHRTGKVLITGEGADELFFGYQHYKEPFEESFAFREYLTPQSIRNCFGPDSTEYFDGIRASQGLYPLRRRALSSPENSRELELKTHLLSLLERNDRISMAGSIEIRAPFLDPNVIRYALMNVNFKDGGKRKDKFSEFLASNFPNLPQRSEKIGFRVPFDESFSAILNSEEGRHLIELGYEFLNSNTGSNFSFKKTVDSRGGWILLNLGIFSELIRDN